jgi:hypothetical protein
MISEHDLLFHPEDYKPLGSIKSVKNLPMPYENSYQTADLKNMFTAEVNKQKMIVSLYKIHRQNGGRSTVDKFTVLIPKLMNAFMKSNNLNQYQSAADNATGNQDWTEALNAINYDFHKYVYKAFKWNVFVPSREYVEVGDYNNRKQVKAHEILAQDIPTLDVWREQQIVIMNKHFRNNNKIPVWRSSIHTRNYDRDDSANGYKYDVDHSSRENFQRVYDMTDIHDTIDKWEDSSWFGL